MNRLLSALAISLLAAACSGGDPDTTPDAGTTGGTDAGGSTEIDAGTPGPTVPLPGFGAISGDCGELDDELTSTDGFTFRNHLDFASDPFDDADKALLDEDSQRMLDTPNAGGSSLLSEVFSFEVLHRCELAKLLKTETEVSYAATGKLTDMVVDIDGYKVGVSVTRAVGYPRDAEYKLETAKSLIKKKLDAINESSKNVSEADRWVKQILHVLAYSDAHADVVRQGWDATDAAARADTVLVVTVTDGTDEFVYGN